MTVAVISPPPRLSCAVARTRISARGGCVVVATYLLAAGDEPPAALVETVGDLYERTTLLASSSRGSGV